MIIIMILTYIHIIIIMILRYIQVHEAACSEA
jgi:hypothetical protein